LFLPSSAVNTEKYQKKKLSRHFATKYAGGHYIYHKNHHSKILNFQNNVLPHINYASGQHIHGRTNSGICHLNQQYFTMPVALDCDFLTMSMAAQNKSS
jgi:hypothetical protein